MEEVAKKLRDLVAKTSHLLSLITETDSAIRPGEGKWSKKEVLGHLIDSASNNHQRFVRAEMENELRFPAYDGDLWVEIQQYQQEPWKELVQNWQSFNLHVSHVISKIPADRLHVRCFVGDAEPVTLGYLVEDYLKHMEHHLKQIFD